MRLVCKERAWGTGSGSGRREGYGGWNEPHAEKEDERLECRLRVLCSQFIVVPLICV
jgi:hypothetical protein